VEFRQGAVGLKTEVNGRDLSWFSGASAFTLSGLAALALSAWLAPQTLPQTLINPSLFRPHLRVDLSPEPREQLAYVLFLLLLIPFLWITLRASSGWVARTSKFFRVLLPVGFVFLGVRKLEWFNTFSFAPGSVTSATLGILALFWARKKLIDQPDFKLSSKIKGFAFWAFCVCVSVWVLFHSVFTEGSLQYASSPVTYHLPFAYNEFIPVLQGATPLVDFNPQYARLLPLVAIPVFKIFGFSILSFTVFMAALNTIALLATARILELIAKSRFKAALFFWTLVGLAVYRDPSDTYLSSVTYHALGPIRTLLPVLSFWLLGEQMNRPCITHLCAAVSMATLAFVNNTDFGLPAWAAIHLGLFLQVLQQDRTNRTDRNRKPLSRNLKVTATAALAATIATLGACLAFWLARAGWPDFSKASDFQKIFALHGFYMLPLPPVGIYLSVLGVLVATLASGFRGFLARRSLTIQDSNPLDIWAPFRAALGIFALGAFFYYVGRSHPKVLAATFWPLSLCLATLAFKNPLSFKNDWARTFILSLFFISGLQGLPSIRDTITKARQLSEETQSSNPSLRQDAFLTELETVKNQIGNAERVTFIQPMGHRLCLALQIRNILPYASEGSLILRRQLDEVIQSAINQNVQIFAFGDERDDLTQALRTAGFEPFFRTEHAHYWKARI
jgi:hypothetical protein